MSVLLHQPELRKRLDAELAGVLTELLDPGRDPGAQGHVVPDEKPDHQRAPEEERERVQDEPGLAVRRRGRLWDPDYVLPAAAARARSVRRLIFPELVSGNSSTNSTTRGYL